MVSNSQHLTVNIASGKYRRPDKPLARPGRKKLQRRIFKFIYHIYYNNGRNFSIIYRYITRLTSNEIFSPSNKIHPDIGRAKDFSAFRKRKKFLHCLHIIQNFISAPDIKSTWLKLLYQTG